MCGIAAIFGYSDGAPPVDRSELLNIRDAMFQRGPDGAGLWISEENRIGLANRRLSIIDLSKNGHQPMASATGQIKIVFNGEIYNYQRIRQDLINKGYEFCSTSDTEVLLNLYLEKGREMVHDLRGMYAFAIWDAEKHGLLIARDPFGIKPLYFQDDGKSFRCASQVKALLAGGKISSHLEPAGQVGFFLWGCVPEPYTLYKNLYSLPPGHTMWVDRDGVRNPRQFFNISEELLNAGNNLAGNHSAQQALAHAITDSVEHHLIADVPVGIFLSSGLDSTTIAALVSENTPNIQAITLGFKEYKDTERDEAPLAQRVAKRYRYEHYVERINQADFEQELGVIINAMDQPTVDGVNTYFVARAAAKKGLKVILSGLGGDELLGSYPGFRQIPQTLLWTGLISKLPGLGKAFRYVSAPVLKRVTSPKYASIFEYGDGYAGLYFLRRSLFMPWELPEFLDGDLVRQGWERLQPILRMGDLISGLDTPRAKISALELSIYMRNMLLRDADWAGMAHSLEIRVPFVDVDVFRALAPFIANVGDPPEKRDLGSIPQQPLPPEIVNRSKTGFAIPIQGWIKKHSAVGTERGLRSWAKYVMRVAENVEL